MKFPIRLKIENGIPSLYIYKGDSFAPKVLREKSDIDFVANCEGYTDGQTWIQKFFGKKPVQNGERRGKIDIPDFE